MTHEQEAKRLIDKYLEVIKQRTDVFNAYSDLSFAKECALICAERCEELAYTIQVTDATLSFRQRTIEYWQNVKNAIQSKSK